MFTPEIVKETPCPSCSGDLFLETRFSTTQLGTYWITGVRLNLPVVSVVWLVCRNCGEEAEGHV